MGNNNILLEINKNAQEVYSIYSDRIKNGLAYIQANKIDKIKRDYYIYKIKEMAKDLMFLKEYLKIINKKYKL